MRLLRVTLIVGTAFLLCFSGLSSHLVPVRAESTAAKMQFPFSFEINFEINEASWREGSQYPTFLRGQLPLPSSARASTLSDSQVAQEFLHVHAHLFGIADVQNELQVMQSEVDTLNISHITFQQVVQGVPVYHALLKLHLQPSANAVIAIGNGYISGIRLDSVIPRFAAREAQQLASRFLPNAQPSEMPVLVVYAGAGVQRSAEQARLAWLIALQNQAEHKLFIVDADKGQLIDILERRYTDRTSDNAQMASMSLSFSNPHEMNAMRIKTYSAENKTSLPGSLKRQDNEPPVGDKDVDDAHDFAILTYNYFLNTHGRDSFDGKGATILSTAHYGQNFHNAAWDGNQMIYGDSFAVLDIVGHELTHAFTQRTAKLEYRWQSGALNESFSDIFAAMIDRSDWLIGEDIAEEFLQQEAVRDMADPTRFDQPAHTDDWQKTCSDQEGVHTNSGIFNKAYYNIATAIGKEKAERIFFRTLTQYLQPTSSFQDARSATLQATTDLYASELFSVTQGFEKVGITANWQPAANDCSCVAIASTSTANISTRNAQQILSTLYELRDQRMATSENGQHYANLYYQHSTEITVLFLANPELRSQTAQILQTLTPGLEELVNHKKRSQTNNMLVTNDLVTSIRYYLANLKDAANSAGNQPLAHLIMLEEARIDWDQLVGMTFAEAWNYFNSLKSISSLYLPQIQR